MEFHENGNRVALALYRKGKIEGQFQSFYPDGSKQRVAKYRSGRLEGVCEEYWPGGDRVWVAQWKAGALDGEAKLNAAGKVVLTQRWKDGQLLELDGGVAFPVSSVEQLAQLRNILASGSSTSSSGDPKFESRLEGLRRLRAYRYLAGLPWRSLDLDPSFNDACDAASEVLEKLGHLTHEPPNPGGMDPARYALGRKGAKSSNLHQIGSIPLSVDGYMDDSDSTNVHDIGHRRWCLNPPLQRVGFGDCKDYSAMWAHDKSGSVPGDLMTVSWPPAGYVPVEFFRQHWAWSISFTTETWPYKEPPHVRVVEVDERYLPPLKESPPEKAWKPASTYGLDHCIVFKPANVKVQPGQRYLVSVSLDSGKTTALQYVVEFTTTASGSPKVGPPVK